jgi:hypothetical protein
MVNDALENTMQVRGGHKYARGGQGKSESLLISCTVLNGLGIVRLA